MTATKEEELVAVGRGIWLKSLVMSMNGILHVVPVKTSVGVTVKLGKMCKGLPSLN